MFVLDVLDGVLTNCRTRSMDLDALHAETERANDGFITSATRGGPRRSTARSADTRNDDPMAARKPRLSRASPGLQERHGHSVLHSAFIFPVRGCGMGLASGLRL
ncbi:hypothetical protein AHiyo8_00790 [Arthrobacter sp. Hiyo8]|nr:hypothetical protein AHiyo8_00790 [Arthrobacter sp. Hiyo8]